MIQKDEWNGFAGRLWKEEINVRDFIQNNYTPYDGDEKFLAGPTAATKKLFDELQKLQIRTYFTHLKEKEYIFILHGIRDLVLQE